MKLHGLIDHPDGSQSVPGAVWLVWYPLHRRIGISIADLIADLWDLSPTEVVDLSNRPKPQWLDVTLVLASEAQAEVRRIFGGRGKVIATCERLSSIASCVRTRCLNVIEREGLGPR